MKSMQRMSVATGAALCAAAFTLSPGFAQEGAKPVNTHTDWGVYVVGEPKECYIATPPSSSTAKRSGETVEVNRGNIQLFVTFRPADKVVNEVSFSAGYPIRDGNAVKVNVGSSDFTLNPGSGDANGWAWPANASEDATIVAAMRRGSKATVTGVSTRGTTTIDEFSLLGFTAALEDAEARCR